MLLLALQWADMPLYRLIISADNYLHRYYYLRRVGCVWRVRGSVVGVGCGGAAAAAAAHIGLAPARPLIGGVQALRGGSQA